MKIYTAYTTDWVKYYRNVKAHDFGINAKDGKPRNNDEYVKMQANAKKAYEKFLRKYHPIVDKITWDTAKMSAQRRVYEGIKDENPDDQDE